MRGDWVNPAAGKVTFAGFCVDWAPRQVWLSSTRANADLAVAGVTFGDMALRAIRRDEALGVQVGDINFLARTLRVTRQIQRAKAADIKAGKNLVEAVAGITVLTRPPKYESERTIYLPDGLVAILAEHVRQHTPDGEPSRWQFDEGGKTTSPTTGGAPHEPTPASPSISTSYGTTSPADSSPLGATSSRSSAQWATPQPRPH